MGYYDWHDVGNEAAFDDSDGITVRDYFAARAPHITKIFESSDYKPETAAEMIAKWAFTFADAMVREKLVLMKERQKADDDRRKRAREKQEASELGRLKKENEVLHAAVKAAGLTVVREFRPDFEVRVEKQQRTPPSRPQKG